LCVSKIHGDSRAVPAYAPELTQVEKVWSTMKGSPANLAVRTATELAAAVKNPWWFGGPGCPASVQ
jgi:hypothetical protein